MKKRIVIVLMVLIAALLCGCVSENAGAEDTVPQSSAATEKKTKDELVAVDKEWPCVSGGFVQPWAFMDYTVEDWENHFEALSDVGMDRFIVQWTAETPNGRFSSIYYPSALTVGNSASGLYNGATFLPRLLEAAEKSEMKVFVGLNLSDEWWNKGLSDSSWNEKEAAIGVQMAEEIYSLYKEKYPNALYGWYFAYEMYNGMRGLADNGGDFLNMYISGLDKLDSSMPIMLSPFVSSSGGSPENAGFEWKEVFKTTDFRDGDIFCCQDAVGAGHIKIEQLNDYFLNLKEAVDSESGLLFWANSEDFTKSGDNYSSADLARFIRQMEIAKPYVSDYVTFAYSHYYAPDYDNKGGYHRAYKHYFETGDKAPDITSPAISCEMDGNRVIVSTEAGKCAGGIREIVLEVNGKKAFTYDVPVASLEDDKVGFEYSITPAEGETSFSITATARDYYGSESTGTLDWTI